MQPRSPEEQALEVGLLADGQEYPWRPSDVTCHEIFKGVSFRIG